MGKITRNLILKIIEMSEILGSKKGNQHAIIGTIILLVVTTVHNYNRGYYQYIAPIIDYKTLKFFRSSLPTVKIKIFVLVRTSF